MAEVSPELAEEVRKLERYHAENPQGRYFVPLANAYRRMGEVDRAEALLREGLRRHPDYLSAHIVLGRCLADRGATGEAVGEFRYVLSVDPQNLIALRSLGELASAGGRTGEAARWYRELLAVDPMNDDARVALESLEAASAAPAGQPSGGAGEWDRDQAETPAEDGAGDFGLIDPLGWGAEGDGAASAPGAADDVAAWGEITLDSAAPGDTPREEPAPDLYGSIEVGGSEPAGGAEPWSAGGTGGWDPLDGATIDLDPPAHDVPEEIEEGEVVTETIAELYARQGFHDRAAEVYRELIRRRGGDPALEGRLREMEARAAGRFPEEPASAGVDVGDPGADVMTPVGDVDLGGIPDLPLVHSGAVDWIEAVPAEAAAPGDDAFAASFEAGFAEPPAAGGEADALPAFAGAPDEEEPAVPEGEPVEGWGTAPAEPVVAAGTSYSGDEPEPAGAAAPATQAAGRSVREYLAALAAWSPGASVAEAPPPTVEAFTPVTADAPVAEPVAAAEPGPAGDREDDDMPWLAAPVPAGSGDAEVGGIEDLLADEPAAAEEEPYPWEVAPAAEEAAPPPPPAESAFSFEDFFMDVAETPAPEAAAPPPAPAAPEPPRSAQPPAQPAAGSATDEDDEDLESFQAWLQSLKR